MIKINLLGPEATPDTSGAFQIAGYVSSIVLTLVICAVLYQLDRHQVSILEVENDRLKTQLEKLKDQTKEVRDLEQKRQELRLIASAIGRLKVVQVGPVKIFSHINGAIPAKAWVRDISDRDDGMVISGIALDDYSVSTFLKNLKSSEIFKTADLVESATASLAQVAAFNAFESKLVRYVVPVPERKSLIEKLKKESEAQGLTLKEEQPRTQEWKRSKGSGTKDRAGTLAVIGDSPVVSGGRGSKVIGFGVRNYSKDNSIYVWSALEETEAKAFKIKLTTDFLKPEAFAPQPEITPGDPGSRKPQGADIPMPSIPSRG